MPHILSTYPYDIIQDMMYIALTITSWKNNYS